MEAAGLFWDQLFLNVLAKFLLDHLWYDNYLYHSDITASTSADFRLCLDLFPSVRFNRSEAPA
jgi:hypothetical protein